jgi:hypothetical protein
MKPPESLPAELFLLAYDTRKGKLTERSHLGYILRAAALSDLWLSGHLVDTGGKAEPGKAKTAPADPLLGAVLDQVAHAPGKPWRHWIRKDQRAAVHVVRDQLETDRVIKVEKYRALGVFPATRITLRQAQLPARLASRVSGAVRGSQPLRRVDPHDAALAALAAAAELRVVLSRAQRRDAKARIAQLTEAAGPVPPALRKVIRDVNAATAAAASSGGG